MRDYWRKNTVCLCIFLVCLLVSCTSTRIERTCDLETILLVQHDFPTGTVVNQISSPIADMPTESAGLSASYVDSSMYHEVARYYSSVNAENKFQEVRDVLYRQTEYRGPWKTPKELSYVNLNAQQYYVACGEVGDNYQCRMIGQYGEYYIFFSAYISNKGVTLDVLSGLLQSLDNHMAQCLQK